MDAVVTTVTTANPSRACSNIISCFVEFSPWVMITYDPMTTRHSFTIYHLPTGFLSLRKEEPLPDLSLAILDTVVLTITIIVYQKHNVFVN